MIGPLTETTWADSRYPFPPSTFNLFFFFFHSRDFLCTRFTAAVIVGRSVVRLERRDGVGCQVVRAAAAMADFHYLVLL